MVFLGESDLWRKPRHRPAPIDLVALELIRRQESLKRDVGQIRCRWPAIRDLPVVRDDARGLIERRHFQRRDVEVRQRALITACVADAVAVAVHLIGVMDARTTVDVVAEAVTVTVGVSGISAKDENFIFAHDYWSSVGVTA